MIICQELEFVKTNAIKDFIKEFLQQPHLKLAWNAMLIVMSVLDPMQMNVYHV